MIYLEQQIEEANMKLDLFMKSLPHLERVGVAGLVDEYGLPHVGAVVDVLIVRVIVDDRQLLSQPQARKVGLGVLKIKLILFIYFYIAFEFIYNILKNEKHGLSCISY